MAHHHHAGYSQVPQHECVHRARPRRTRGACYDCCVVMSAIIFPPLAVLAVKGCGMDFFINFMLTLLGLLPGTIHALFIVFAYPRDVMGHSPEEIEEANVPNERTVIVVRPPAPQGGPTCGHGASHNHHQAYSSLPQPSSSSQSGKGQRTVEYPPPYDKS